MRVWPTVTRRTRKMRDCKPCGKKHPADQDGCESWPPVYLPPVQSGRDAVTDWIDDLCYDPIQGG